MRVRVKVKVNFRLWVEMGLELGLMLRIIKGFEVRIAEVGLE